MGKNKLIVVGLDGATWDVIKPWADKGVLPTFKKLMDNGSWGALESTIPPVTGPAWVSFATGRNPGKHGFFDFVKMERNELKMHTSGDLKIDTFYDTLSKNGFKNIIISMPFSFPPKKGFNGIMTSDFLYPKNEIFPKGKSDYKYKRIPDLSKRGEELLEDMIRTAEEEVAVAKRLYTDEEWDSYFFYYKETDEVSHNFWKEIERNGKLVYKVEQIFKIADEFLGWVVEQMDEKSILLIMSDHGFGGYPYQINLNTLLKKEGLVKTIYKENNLNNSEGFAKHMEIFRQEKRKGVRLPKLFHAIGTFPIIKPLAEKIFHLVWGDNAHHIFNAEKVDFMRSKAFIPTSESLAVYVNGSDSEKTKIVSYLVNLLKKLNYKGIKVFREVYLRSEVYNGPFLADAPDILLVLNKFFISPSFLDRKIFTNFNPGGWHKMNGIFLAYGSQVKKGFKVENAKIYDLAPTILHIFDLPIVTDIDGRVLNEIYQADSELSTRKPKLVDYHESKRKELKQAVRGVGLRRNL